MSPFPDSTTNVGALFWGSICAWTSVSMFEHPLNGKSSTNPENKDKVIHRIRELTSKQDLIIGELKGYLHLNFMAMILSTI